ncbi:hypothetical protein SB775_09260 [Peribacillus sp. SIMBA_075]|uniref:hypothetical protein n=1 Tax=Peribacillus sp. SIMBA_075 TaxID=3085813 RepID=UPI00397C40F8
MSETALKLLESSEYTELDYAIHKICSLMIEIIQIHKDFSQEWREVNQFNLKKTLIRDIVEPVDDSNAYFINEEFHSVLKSYLSKIDQLTIDIDLEYTYSEYDFRLRVKQPESIIYKLGHYNSGKTENGRFPLNKCLNDLLGFRIIMPGFIHDCELFSKMCNVFENDYKIKYRNSSKGEYIATHIYFYGDNNKNFPWELQVWLPEDFENNYESHAKHKQEYIKSAKIHKQAFDL